MVSGPTSQWTAALPSIWTTLRVVTTAAGDVKVYADGSLVYATASSLMASGDWRGLV